MTVQVIVILEILATNVTIERFLEIMNSIGCQGTMNIQVTVQVIMYFEIIATNIIFE